ncbi:hypothetical protein ACDA63_13210 [Uliginosibacterium sp. sgz301328]|uniref:hypothetical protein n=1 Tax=Uliginosibacterium sp. sgz301328 TaxID=3243764 RepID=UPI00359D044F
MSMIVNSAANAAQFFHRVGNTLDSVSSGLSSTEKAIANGVTQATQTVASTARTVVGGIGSVIDILV